MSAPVVILNVLAGTTVLLSDRDGLRPVHGPTEIVLKRKLGKHRVVQIRFKPRGGGEIQLLQRRQPDRVICHAISDGISFSKLLVRMPRVKFKDLTAEEKTKRPRFKAIKTGEEKGTGLRLSYRHWRISIGHKRPQQPVEKLG